MKRVFLSFFLGISVFYGPAEAGCSGIKGCLSEAGKIVSNEAKSLGADLSNGWKHAGLVVSDQYKTAVEHTVDIWHSTYERWIPEEQFRWIVDSTAEMAVLYPTVGKELWTILLLKKLSDYADLKRDGAFSGSQVDEVADGMNKTSETTFRIQNQCKDDSAATVAAQKREADIKSDFLQCMKSADGDFSKQNRCYERNNRNNEKSADLAAKC